MSFLAKYNKTRGLSMLLCEPISIEDANLQCNYDVSPTKWQLAHITWYFEEFVLKKFVNNYRYYNESYLKLFNSYYLNKGERFDKNFRYLISRPSYYEIVEYRKIIDERINKLFVELNSDEANFLLNLGIEHEMQHQELILMDIKLNLFHNPNIIFYNEMNSEKSINRKMNFLNVEEGIYEFGKDNYLTDDFVFDNETPKHKRFIEGFQIANRVVSNREYLEFVNSNGYNDFNLWLSDGWDFIKENNIKHPLYWVKKDDTFFEYTLHNFNEIDLDAPVKHISYYEAWAFAKWYGGRLATEFELELAADKYNNNKQIQGLVDSKSYFEPVVSNNYDFLGGVWEWAESAYLPYPRYKQAEGALGEYNGKFMVNKMVLRGACAYTPLEQCRLTYRNFFTPDKRWVLSGIRLVKGT